MGRTETPSEARAPTTSWSKWRELRRRELEAATAAAANRRGNYANPLDNRHQDDDNESGGRGGEKDGLLRKVGAPQTALIQLSRRKARRGWKQRRAPPETDGQKRLRRATAQVGRADRAKWPSQVRLSFWLRHNNVAKRELGAAQMGSQPPPAHYAAGPETKLPTCRVSARTKSAKSMLSPGDGAAGLVARPETARDANKGDPRPRLAWRRRRQSRVHVASLSGSAHLQGPPAASAGLEAVAPSSPGRARDYYGLIQRQVVRRRLRERHSPSRALAGGGRSRLAGRPRNVSAKDALRPYRNGSRLQKLASVRGIIKRRAAAAESSPNEITINHHLFSEAPRPPARSPQRRHKASRPNISACKRPAAEAGTAWWLAARSNICGAKLAAGLNPSAIIISAGALFDCLWLLAVVFLTSSLLRFPRPRPHHRAPRTTTTTTTTTKTTTTTITTPAKNAAGQYLATFKLEPARRCVASLPKKGDGPETVASAQPCSGAPFGALALVAALLLPLPLFCPLNWARLRSVHCASPNNSAAGPELDLEARWLARMALLSDDAAWPASQQLARQLARWPDKRAATLLYLDQLARRLEQTGAAGSQMPALCPRESLAQLMAAGGGLGGDAAAGADDERSARRLLELDDLLRAKVWPARLAEHLSGRGPGRHSADCAKLAQLAVECASLLTRLLSMNNQQQRPVPLAADRETDNDSAGQGFFKSFFHFRRSIGAGDGAGGQPIAGTRLDHLEQLLYKLVGPKLLNFMLEYKLKEFALERGSRKALQMLHSTGLILFRDEGAQTSQWEEPEPDQAGDTEAETGRDDDSTNKQPADRSLSGPKLEIVHATLAALATDGNGANGHGHGTETRPRVKLVDLLEATNASERQRQQRDISRPSPVQKWLRMADRPTGSERKWLAQLSRRLFFSGSRQQQQHRPSQQDLNVADGSWFAPRFDCGLHTNRWLLTYSIPFLTLLDGTGQNSQLTNGENGGTTAELAGARIRGVAYVNLDLARTGPLISQCASSPTANEYKRAKRNYREQEAENIPSFLADTNNCKLIGSSQCVPLPEYFAPANVSGEGPQFRPGAYVCQCPAIGAASSELRAAPLPGNRNRGEPVSGANGDHLASAQLQPAGWQASSSGKVSLDDRQAVAQLLLARRVKPLKGADGSALHLSNSSPVGLQFVLGAALDAELALQALAGGTDGTKDETPDDEDARRLLASRLGLGAIASLRPELRGRERSCAACKAANCLRLNKDEGGAADKWHTLIGWLRPTILAVQIGCLIITFVLIGVMLRIQRSRTIIVSGWLMLETMLLGAMLLYASVLVRYFQASSFTCLLEPWLRELGFSVFYGSILIKLYRILSEFQTRKAHRVCLRDKDQMLYLLAIVLIVVGYMSAWTALMVDSFFVRQAPSVLPQAEPSIGFAGAHLDNLLAEEAAWAPSQPRQGVETLNKALGGSGPDDESAAGRALNELDRQLDVDIFRRLRRASTADTLEAELTPTPISSSALTERHLSGKFATKRKLATNFIVLAPENTTLSGREPALQGQLGQLNALWIKATTTTTAPEFTTGLARTKRDSVGIPPANSLNNHLEILARGLNSFGELFLGLLETDQKFDIESDTFSYSIRCRKLTWDYVTESSELALLVFGLHLVYKLRNASVGVHKEKLILSVAVFMELALSALAYLVRHALWPSLTSDHLLVIYTIRCQLTVTLTVVLVFGPKLWNIGKGRPGLLLGVVCGRWAQTMFANHAKRAGVGLAATTGSSAGSGPGEAGSATAQVCAGRGASARHRCHISCELHDHHLNDASRLHQAMLSNSALEIGSINLADMDPDEIQAELKRVYTQLELLKTKVMRRDNPHISKRRGGRKPGHRKFSLQAFHGRHSTSSGVDHGAQAAAAVASAAVQSQPNPAQSNTVIGSLSQHSQAGCELVQSGSARQLHQTGVSAASSSPIERLPALAELEGEGLIAGGLEVEQGQIGTEKASTSVCMTTKHVRVDESASALAWAQHHQAHTKQVRKQQLFRSRTDNTNSKSSSVSSTSTANRPLIGPSNQNQHGPAKWTPELPSTSSLGFDDEMTMMMNDSQSSGELTPQHRTSIAFNQAQQH